MSIVRSRLSLSHNVNDLLSAGSGEIPQLAVALGTIDALLDAVDDCPSGTAYGFGELGYSHEVVALWLVVEKPFDHRRQSVDLDGELPYLLLLCHFSLVTQVSTIPLLDTLNS